jgi:drug/metabolite transporter (DMT)-like permease
MAWTLLGSWKDLYFDWHVLTCGALNAGIIISTIYAMQNKVASVFMTALIIKGNNIALSPFADKVTHNKIRPRSIVACILSAIGLVLLNLPKLNQGTSELPKDQIIAYVVCTLCYAIKLPLFSRIKKNPEKTLKFLTSHQTISVLIFLIGSYVIFGTPKSIKFGPLAVGFFSQLTGLFGSMILLGIEEHAACVPLKSASAMIAGLVAAYLLSSAVTVGQFFGLGFLLSAILILLLRRDPS